jgi:DNA-binding NarL/FixJ family response regulator
VDVQRILIVDSDPIVALVTQRGLQRLLGTAAEVTVATSPGAAWLRCQRIGTDLLIVDPGSQNQAAIALIKALRSEQPDVPVLVLASHDTPPLQRHMAALGVQRYLAKPVELAALVQAVHEAALPDKAQSSAQVKPS